MQYSGRVIGGFHAGEYHSFADNILKLPVPFCVSDLAPIDLTEIPTDIASLIDNVAVYRHQSMWWKNNETGQKQEFHFWVPWEIKNPQPFILETLIESYINANR